MRLDDLPSPAGAERLSTRLWRRYSAEALGMLESVRRDPRMAEVIIETSEYRRCELDEAARREMVVKLEDFLRRRSKISLVVRREDIRRAPGLREACAILLRTRHRRQDLRVLRRSADAWRPGVTSGALVVVSASTSQGISNPTLPTMP